MKPNRNKTGKTLSEKPDSHFRIFFSTLLLILPMVYVTGVQDPSMMPRMAGLTVFLLLWSLFLWTGKGIMFPSINLLTRAPMVFSGLYLLMVLVSMVFSANPAEGYSDILKTGLTLLVMLFAARQFLQTRDWFGKLSSIVLIALIIALLVGYYQFLSAMKTAGQDPSVGYDTVIRMVKGLTGNKNEYSSFLMLLLPFSAWPAFFGKGRNRSIAMIAVILTVVMLILLTTRAVWLGMVAALSFIVLMFIVFPKTFGVQKRKARLLAWVMAGAAILLAAGILEGGKYSQNRYLEKLGSIVRPSEDNNHFRLKVWKITGEMTLDHPVTGVGPGNWQIVIPEYYSRIGLKGKEVNWITPHNDFLWILAEKGFIGLLLYLGMVVSLFFMAAKVIKGPGEKELKTKALLLTGGFIAYLVVACFDFSYQRVEHQIMFALYLAAMIAWTDRQEPQKNRPVNRNTLLIPVTIFLALGTFFSITVVKMQYHLKSALTMMKNGNFAGAEEEIRRAHTPLKNIDALGSPVSYYAGLISDQLGNKPAALQHYRSALAVHPNHLAVLNNLGKSYFDAGNYGLAEYYYLRALKIVPGYMETRVNLSTLYYKKGEYQRSLDQLKEIKGVRKPDVVKQNMRILRKMTGTSADSLAKSEKMKKKALKKEEKRKSGKKRPIGHE